ncbi:MAG: hypothetical protein ACFE7R_11060, partial [Candidatus Hodarchaeota archaeon]
QNSHLYSTGVQGVDTTIEDPDIYIVGASTLQFLIFGDPDVTLYDWDREPHAFVSFESGFGPSSPIFAHPGSSYDLPLGGRDPVGNLYAKAGNYSITVYDPSMQVISSGNVVFTGDALGTYRIDFSPNAPLGEYTTSITNTDTGRNHNVTILLEWPELVIESIDVTGLMEYSNWSVIVVAHNPQDVPVDTLVRFYVGSTLLAVDTATWQPRFSQKDFEFEVLGVPSGSQEFRIEMLVGPEAILCSVSDIAVSIAMHWSTPLLWGLIPGLTIAAVLTGFYSWKKAGEIHRLRKAKEDEAKGQKEGPFETYCSTNLSRSAARVAFKAGLPDEMLKILVSRFSKQSSETLRRAALSAAEGDNFILASRIFKHLGDRDLHLRFLTLAEIKDGSLRTSAKLLEQLLHEGLIRSALAILVYLRDMDNQERKKQFVDSSRDTLLSFAPNIRNAPDAQELLLSVLPSDTDDSFYLALDAEMERFDGVADRILASQKVPEMVRLTNGVRIANRRPVAARVTQALLSSHKPQQVASYLTSVDLSGSDLAALARPIAEKFLENPSDAELGKALSTISASGEGGSIIGIRRTLDAASTYMETTKGIGKETEMLSTSELIDAAKSLKDPETIKLYFMLIERQVLNESDPSMSDVSRLARYTQDLRIVQYKMEGENRFLSQRFQELSALLIRRLVQDARSLLLQCTFKVHMPDWLKSSSDEICSIITSQINKENPTALVEALLKAREEKDFAELSKYVAQSISAEVQAAEANRILSDARMRQILTRKHSQPRRMADGSIVTTPDVAAINAEAARMALARWFPQAAQAWRTGVLMALRSISIEAARGALPERQRAGIAVRYLETFTKLAQGKAYGDVIHFLREIRYSFESTTLSDIVARAGVPSHIVQQALGPS